MKIGIKLAIIGVLSLVVGTVFVSPLLITELDIVPFWVVPQGPKVDFSVNVVFTNFTVHETSEFTIKGDNISELNYFIVLNVTNPSDFSANVSTLNLAVAKDITIIPSALGGYFVLNDGSLKSDDLGPSEGYLGHVASGRVEGLWLDEEWINTPWVPEGGLMEIWESCADIPAEGFEHIWSSDIYHPDMSNTFPPFTSYRGTNSNDTMYYSYSGTIFHVEGGNYWIEGVPLREHISEDGVKSTMIYYNSSWIDVTGRIEIKEHSFAFLSHNLVDLQTSFFTLPFDNSFYSGWVWAFTNGFGSHTLLPDGFNSTWEPHQSRLILLRGSVDMLSLNESLTEGEIIFYTELINSLNNQTLDRTHVDTKSHTTGLKTVQLEKTERIFL